MKCKNCKHKIAQGHKQRFKKSLWTHLTREDLQWNSRCTVGLYYGTKRICGCVKPEPASFGSKKNGDGE